MIKYIIFGAGNDGKQALCELGAHRIAYFIDNNKRGKIGSFDIYTVEEGIKRMESNMLILIPSKKYRKSMMQQLEKHGVSDYLFYSLGSMQYNKIDEKIGKDEWGKLYGNFHIEQVVSDLKQKKYTVWTEEILKLSNINDNILEIGCGTGQSSVSLALEGRNVTAMDYSEGSIATVNEICERMGTQITTICYDATLDLPFKNHEFDIVFQAGLLEHFSTEEQIKMLTKWRRVGKKMISMIPNANSLLYRAGKEKMEKEDEWPFGLEIPQASMYEVFLKSGYTNIKEYTIGMENAKNFLPEDNYLRVAIEKLIREGHDLCDWGQGYLLVTYGESE